MYMSEFDKIKIGFAIGLLAAAFALTPLVKDIGIGFSLFGVSLQIIHVFWSFVILLGLSVYLFAISLVGNNSFLDYAKKTANLSYALSLLVLPLYLSLYIVKQLSDLIEIILKNEIAGTIFQTFISVSLGVVANILTNKIMISFKKKERKEQVEKIAVSEEKVNRKIEELLSFHLYDLAVIQIWKSIELTLTKTLLNLDYPLKDKSTLKLISNSYEQKIISKELFQELRDLVGIRNLAVHTDKVVTEVTAKNAFNTLTMLNQHLAKVTEQCYFCNKTFPITELKNENVTGAYVCKKCDEENPDWRDMLISMGQDP